MQITRKLSHPPRRNNPKIDAFLLEVIEVCKKHGLSIGHEDHHGGFQIADYDEEFDFWLWQAEDYTEGKGDYIIFR